MVIKEIQQFSEIRPKARAYLCYILSRNIPNRTPEVTLETIISALKKIKKEVNEIDTLYILDARGRQVINNISATSSYRLGEGENRAEIDPEKLVYAVYLIGGVAMMLFGLSFYLKSIRKERVIKENS